MTFRNFISPEAEVNEDDFVEDNAMMASALPDDLHHIPLTTYKRYSEQEMIKRSVAFYEEMNNRRTLRFYSQEDVPKEVIENIIKAGGKSSLIAIITRLIYASIYLQLLS